MVVKLAGKCLSPHVYSLISHIEVSYSELFKCKCVCSLSFSLHEFA